MLINSKYDEIIEQSQDKKDYITVLAYATKHCNFKCSYCADFLKNGDDFLNINILEKYIYDILLKTNRRVELVFIGGEPTLNKDIKPFCERLHNKMVAVEIVSNFSESVEYYNDLLSNGTRFVLSWHGRDKDGGNKEYVDKMDLIEDEYMENGMVDIRIMAENNNFNKSKEAFFTLYNKHYRNIEFLELHDTKCKRVNYTKEQSEQIRDILPYTQNKKKDFIVKTKKQTKYVSFNDLYLNDTISYRGWKCMAGLDCIYVHSDGNVYNCQSFCEHGVGKLYNIYENGGVYQTELHKPCICKVDYCSCDFDVHKEKILKGCKK